MYSPVLSETMVKTLYRLKCSQDRPMTVVVEFMVRKLCCAPHNFRYVALPVMWRNSPLASENYSSKSIRTSRDA